MAQKAKQANGVYLGEMMTGKVTFNLERKTSQVEQTVQFSPQEVFGGHPNRKPEHLLPIGKAHKGSILYVQNENGEITQFVTPYRHSGKKMRIRTYHERNASVFVTPTSIIATFAFDRPASNNAAEYAMMAQEMYDQADEVIGYITNDITPDIHTADEALMA